MIAALPATTPSPTRRVVPDLLADRALETPDGIAFYALDEHDAWAPVTWRQFAQRVASIVLALRKFGLRRGQHAAILAPTSVEWEYAQMACLTLGMSVVGIDVNYPPEQRDEALRAIAIDVLFVQDMAAAKSIPVDVAARLSRIVCLAAGAEASRSGIESLLELAEAPAGLAADEPGTGAQPDDTALVVFSSGTTGRPKAIAYSHRQVLVAVASILDAYPDIAEGSHLLCWLPLANLFQRIVDLCGIQRGATSYVIGDPREVMRYVRSASPHLLIGVPRFFEKLHTGICDRIAQSPRPIAALTGRVLAGGVGRARAARERRKISVYKRGTARIADRLVLRRLRRTFGSNLRYLISGSAPMPLWLLDWFEGIGLPVLEAYGVSESIVPIAMNTPAAHRPGTVGRPLAGQELRVAEDNEVLIRGPGVFHGYLADHGRTVSGLGADGFWPTADFGELDADGYLRLRGRKSEIFKLSTGRWIAPAAIEALLRRLPYVEHALALGAGHRCVVAVLAIDPGRLAGAKAQRGLAGRAWKSMAHDPATMVRRDVIAATADLAAHERPAGVLLASSPFTIEGGELTANLKLRRDVVEARYAAGIDGIYAALGEASGQPGDELRGDSASPLVRLA